MGGPRAASQSEGWAGQHPDLEAQGKGTQGQTRNERSTSGVLWRWTPHGTRGGLGAEPKRMPLVVSTPSANQGGLSAKHGSVHSRPIVQPPPPL